MVQPDNNLKSRALAGLKWTAIDTLGQQTLRLAVLFVLARLLEPGEFGMVAMVSVFIAVATGITDAGFGQAIIQRKELDRVALSSVFYLNLAMALVMVAVVWCCAPWIASFYNQPSLSEVVRILSISIPLSALSRIQLSQLERQLDFRRCAAASLTSVIISGIVAVVSAYNGLGVWALVSQSLTFQSFQTLLLWWGTSWRPTFEFSWTAIKPLFEYGSKLAISGVVTTAFNNIYALVIGRFFLPADVGFYQLANRIKNFTSEGLNSIVSRVTFPLYSAIQDDQERLRRAFLLVSRNLALAFFPLMGALSALSTPLVRLLLGDGWIQAARYLELLCLVGAFFPLHAINVSIVKALGQSGANLRISLLKKMNILCALAITIQHGVMAMVVGQVITSFIALWINAYYVRKFLSVGYRIQFRQYTFPLSLALTVFVGGRLVAGVGADLSLTIQLTAGLFVCGIAYAVVVACYPGPWIELAGMLPEKIRSGPSRLWKSGVILITK